jgi:hypothetical protein
MRHHPRSVTRQTASPLSRVRLPGEVLQTRDVGGDHGRLAPQLHGQLGPPVGAASGNLDDGEEPAVGTVDCTSELRVYFNGAGVRDGIAEFNSRGPRPTACHRHGVSKLGRGSAVPRFIVEVDGRQVEPICGYLGLDPPTNLASRCRGRESLIVGLCA